MEKPTRIIRGAKKTGNGNITTYLVEMSDGSRQEMSVRGLCRAAEMKRNTFYSRVRDEDIYSPNFFRPPLRKRYKTNSATSVSKKKRSIEMLEDDIPLEIQELYQKKLIKEQKIKEKTAIKNNEYRKELKICYDKGGMNRLCNGGADGVII